jgi:hypothetical protein
MIRRPIERPLQKIYAPRPLPHVAVFIGYSGLRQVGGRDVTGAGDPDHAQTPESRPRRHRNVGFER